MAKVTNLDEKRRFHKFFTTVKRLLVVVVVTVIAFFIYSFRFELTSQGIGVTLADAIDYVFDNRGFPVDISSEPVLLSSVGKRPVIITKNTLAVFNPAGNKVIDERLTETSTVTSAAGKQLLIFSRGGYNIRLLSGETEMYVNKFDQPIYNAVVSKTGAFAVSTATSGAQSKVTVFDKKMNEQFVWTSAEEIIHTMDLDTNASQVAIGGVALQLGELNSTLSVFDTANGKEHYTITLKDQLLLELFLEDSGEVTAITDKAVIFLSRDGKTQNVFPFDNISLTAYSVGKDSVAVALGDFKTSHSLTIFWIDKTAKVENIVTIDHPIIGLDWYNDQLIVFTGDTVVRYDSEYEKASTITTPGALQGIIIDKDIYYSTLNGLNRTVIQ